MKPQASISETAVQICLLLIGNWKFCFLFSPLAVIQQKGSCYEMKLAALIMPPGFLITF